MTTFTSLVPERTQPDPAKHVNYTIGMLLGVDDFVQEFAYLSAKDRDGTRELGGSGVLRGLRVDYQPTPPGTDRAPRLAVAPGLALAPSGRLIAVAPTQCADLVSWLAGHRDEVVAALGGVAGSGSIDLAIVLGYSECATDAMPVPGEPCRSDDDLLAPSRLRDDFRLELLAAQTPAQQAALPAQAELIATRGFIRWLRLVPVVGAGASATEEIVEAVRTAAGRDTADAPCPAPDAVFTGPPPAGLAMPVTDLAAVLRAVFQTWARELLPCWRVAGGSGLPASTDAADLPDSLRLAAVRLDVLHDAVTDTFSVGPAGAVVSTDDHPFLLNAGLIQEWMLTVPAIPADPLATVAAGRLDPTGAAPAPPFFSRGGLTATRRAAPHDDVYDLAFAAFDPAEAYLVTGVPVVELAAPVHTVELAPPGPTGAPAVRVRPQPAQLQALQLQVLRVQP